MNPDDVPEALVNQAMHSIRPPLREDATRRVLAAAWDWIYSAGENNGFADGYQKAMSDHGW